MFAFILVAAVSLLLLAMRRTDRNGSLAFGPWMIGGAVLAGWAIPAVS